MDYSKGELDKLASDEITFINRKVLAKGTFKVMPRYPYWSVRLGINGGGVSLVVHTITEDGRDQDWSVAI